MTDETTESFFSGPERIELSKIMGRPFRKGSPAALDTPDFDCVIAAIKEKNVEKSFSYLNNLHPLYELIVGTFIEWAIALRNETSKVTDLDKEKIIAYETHKIFSDVIKTAGHYYTEESKKLALDLLNPEVTTPETIFSVRQNKSNHQPSLITSYLDETSKLYSELTECINKKDFTLALGIFEKYFTQIKSRHDIMGHYVSVYSGVSAVHLNEKLSVDVLQKALESCAVLEHMWAAVEVFSPEARAAMLAEHLRHHYSGPERKGAVKIVEDNEAIRLIFEPCGTGGAMRANKLGGLYYLNEPSPENWNKSGQVCTYCSHCAKNELTSMEKFGYPAWVTEFNPDPNKPCGWTIYKDPKSIPENYFTRIGYKKDISKFK